MILMASERVARFKTVDSKGKEQGEQGGHRS